MATRHDVSVHASAFGWGWGCSCGRSGTGNAAPSPEAARAHGNRHVVTERRRETAAANAAYLAARREARA